MLSSCEPTLGDFFINCNMFYGSTVGAGAAENTHIRNQVLKK